jgi:hypothetical protein
MVPALSILSVSAVNRNGNGREEKEKQNEKRKQDAKIKKNIKRKQGKNNTLREATQFNMEL